MTGDRRLLVELSLASLDGAIMALKDMADRYGADRTLTLGDFIAMLETIASDVRGDADE